MSLQHHTLLLLAKAFVANKSCKFCSVTTRQKLLTAPVRSAFLLDVLCAMKLPWLCLRQFETKGSLLWCI